MNYIEHVQGIQDDFSFSFRKNPLVFLIILFCSFFCLPEGLRILETSKRYTCLKYDDFEAEAIWRTEKTMGQCLKGSIISILRELPNIFIWW